MKNINFKNIKDLGTKLFYNSLYENSDFSYKDFIKDIKQSPVLRTQYIVYSNVENNKFDDRETAAYFLKENFDLFKQFSKKEILDANQKLTNKFFSKIEINEEEDRIFDLIVESTKDKKSTNYKKKAETFNSLLNEIVTKEVIQESEEVGGIEFNQNIPIKRVIKRASEIINEKYSFFDEENHVVLFCLAKDKQYVSLMRKNVYFRFNFLF